MSIILNYISIIATFIVIMGVLNFLWRAILTRSNLFCVDSFMGIKMYHFLSMITFVVLLIILDIRFYKPW